MKYKQNNTMVLDFKIYIEIANNYIHIYFLYGKTVCLD